MVKRSWLLVLAILVSLLSANALDAKVNAIRDTVLPGQDAEYIVSISSNEADSIGLSYSDDFWRARINPSSFILTPGVSNDNIRVLLYPLSNARPGSYSFKLRAVSLSRNEIIQEIPLNVILADKDNAVEVSVLTSSLNPSLVENLLQIRFENNYNIEIKDMKASIASKLFSHDAVIDLGPRGSKVEDIVIKLDQNIAEGDYVMEVQLSLNDIELTNIKRNINVGKLSNVRRNIDFAGGIFTKVKEVKFVNEGNTVVRQTYTESLSLLADFFTKTNPDPSFVQGEGGSRQLAWEIELKPGESRIIGITTGYRGFVILLIVLLAIIGLWYFLFSKNVSITKKVVNVSGEHDAFGSIRVNLQIRNRSKDRLHNLRVLDRIPSYLRAEKEEFIGIHPESVKRVIGGGTVLVWNIAGLEPGAGTVISYRVKTKLHIFGKLTLPNASVKYKNAAGRIVTASSNRMMLFSWHSE